MCMYNVMYAYECLHVIPLPQLQLVKIILYCYNFRCPFAPICVHAWP